MLDHATGNSTQVCFRSDQDMRRVCVERGQ